MRAAAVIASLDEKALARRLDQATRKQIEALERKVGRAEALSAVLGGPKMEAEFLAFGLHGVWILRVPNGVVTAHFSPDSDRGSAPAALDSVRSPLQSRPMRTTGSPQ